MADSPLTAAGRPEQITISELASRYPAVLLDSFGVLVDGDGALPGATELVSLLPTRGVQLLVVTNDASRLPSTCAARYQSLGLGLTEEQILTSGMLIAPHLTALGLLGATTLVLGTDDSREYARAAGAEVAPINPDIDYQVIIAADDAGFDYFEGVDAALSSAIRTTERGQPPTLLLPNPDLIYPKAPGHYGFTAGAVAMVIEAGLRRRLGPGAPSFDALGKPNPPIFRAALERIAGPAVMVGDQLETDIAGASRVGIATALLTTGVTRLRGDEDIVPNFVISSLWP